MNHFFVPKKFMGADRIVDNSAQNCPRIEAYFFDVFGGKLRAWSEPLPNGFRITRIDFEIGGKVSYSQGTQEINNEEDFNERAALVISNAIEYLQKEKGEKK